jgi:hypothetical protein
MGTVSAKMMDGEGISGSTPTHELSLSKVAFEKLTIVQKPLDRFKGTDFGTLVV